MNTEKAATSVVTHAACVLFGAMLFVFATGDKTFELQVVLVGAISGMVIAFALVVMAFGLENTLGRLLRKLEPEVKLVDVPRGVKNDWTIAAPQLRIVK